MPAPPKPNETKSEFIGRCVPVVIDEGRPKDQAIAICYSMWRKKHPGAKAIKSDTLSSLKDTLSSIQVYLNQISKYMS